MRPDGKRVKNADPMYTIVPYIMVKRYDAMNMITVDIPVEPMQAYRVKARKGDTRSAFWRWSSPPTAGRWRSFPC